MSEKNSLVILLVLLFSLTACSLYVQPEKEIVDEAEDLEELDKIEEKINNMTLDEKIGQLLVFGLNGSSIDQHTKEMIEENYIGGFILFKSNIENGVQTIELLNSLKLANNSNPLPLFLSIDDEGGQVDRLSDIFLKLPEAKKIGDINRENISFDYGRILGMRTSSLGFNMNYAPVFDVNSNPNNPVIGNRAFASSVDLVADNGLKVVEGMNSEGTISIIKHFPGHGDTSVDSHLDIPIVDKELSEIMDLELIPFIRGIEKGVDGIMVGHLLYPKLDEDRLATMSGKIIGKLLREELSYEGLVVSDDMTMGAVVENYSIEEASMEFLKSGGDLLLICHGYENQEKVLDRIREGINNGELPLDDLDEKVYRIIQLKKKYKLEDGKIDGVHIDFINIETEKFLDEIGEIK